MSSFEYTPIDLEGRSFRLLRLCKGEGGYMKCELFDAWLQDKDAIISYEALSYTWGAPDKPYTIEVNGFDMPITRNLYLALRQLREPYQDKIVWADAICIDQNNPKERGHQVRQMSFIYHQAERVAIWLSRGTPETDLVFDLLAHVKEEAERKGSVEMMLSDESWASDGSSVRILVDEARETTAKKQQKGLRELMEQAWFKRVWIIQEVAKARSARVLCGNKSAAANEFAMLPSLLGMEPEPHCQAILDIMPGLTRKHSWWSKSQDLWTLLVKFRESEASEPRDVIFALLGVSSDWRETDALEPNYEKSIGEVIHDTIRFLLGLPREATYAYSLPDWTMPEFLENIESVRGALFSWAIEHEDERTAKVLLTTSTMGVNSKNKNGQTPLIIATDKGLANMVELLLNTNNIELNSQDADNQTALLLAVKSGHEDITQHLLKSGNINVNLADKEGQTPLLVAAENGQEEVVMSLIKRDELEDGHVNKLGWMALYKAALNGYTEITRALVDFRERKEQMSGSKPMRPDIDPLLKELFLKAVENNLPPRNGLFEEKPLWWAALSSHDEILEMLMQKDDIDASWTDPKGERLMTWAMDNFQYKIVRLLVQTGRFDMYTTYSVTNTKFHRAPPKMTLLDWAAGCRCHEIATMLLNENGIDLNAEVNQERPPICVAVRYANRFLVELLLEKDGVDLNIPGFEGRTAVWEAAEFGSLAILQLLLESGRADVNKKSDYGESALWRAAEYGQYHTVKVLLSSARIDLDSKDDRNQRTPLRCAADFGHVDMVESLLKSGQVDPDSRDRNGRTILSSVASNDKVLIASAAYDPRLQILKLLLDTGRVDPDAKDRNGWTPLMGAVEKDREAIVEKLLETGQVDLNSKDCHGNSPLSLAVERGHERIMTLLTEYRGNLTT